MYKILILFDAPGWAYHFRALALKKYKPVDFSIVDISSRYGMELKKCNYDLVFQLAYSYVKPVREHLQKNKYKCKLISSYNIGYNHNNSWLDSTIKYSDAVIINNFEMWDKSGRRPNTYHISNGVDSFVYHVKIPYEQRRFKALWVGSKFHRKVKNYDNILIPLSRELNRRKILTDFKLVNSTGHERLSSDKMCDWYNTGQCYVVASTAEGTPNPMLESAACGLPIVSTKVGNAPELIKDGYNGYLCERTVQSLLDGVLKVQQRKEEMSKNILESIKSWDWSIRSKEFFDLFRKVINNK